MTLLLYRSDCYLFHADGWQVLSWSDWSFDPISPAEARTAAGYSKLRDQPLPFAIVTAPLAKRLGSRLILADDKEGIDAASAWHLAVTGQRGFRIQETADVKQQSLFSDDPPPAKKIAVAPAAEEIHVHIAKPAAELLPATESALLELITRAVEQLSKDQPMTARAILQGALEDFG